MEPYWRTLYDTPIDSISPTDKVLKVGPLLYRRNELESSENLRDLFVRDVYSTLYKSCYLDLRTVQADLKMGECNTPEHFFFTGTPGVGKSCFRTYMIWRHIQELKSQKLTGVVWASKSPKGEAFAQLLVIEGGEMRGAFEVRSVDTDIVANRLKHARIMTLAHVDVSKGNSDDISVAKAFIKFYYTSPNEAAWKEQSKVRPSFRLYYVPEFSEDELVEFFYDMCRHPELMRRLEERKRAAVSTSAEARAAMDDRSVAREIIAEEAFEYGFVPRSMFDEDKEAFDVDIKEGVRHLKGSLYAVRATSRTLDESVRHSLLSFEIDSSNLRLLKEIRWRGAYVVSRVIEGIIEDIGKAAQHGDVYKLFPGDPKLFESLFIGLFAQEPSYLCIDHLLPTKRGASEKAQRSKVAARSDIEESDDLRIDADKIRYVSSAAGAEVASASDSSDSSSSSSSSSSEGANVSAPTAFFAVKFVSNSGMMAFAADIDRRGVVAPVNRYYPCIDGIARFEHEGSIITAFLQTIRSASHPIGEDGRRVLEDLKGLAEKAAKDRVGKPHRCVFMWLCSADVAKDGVSLDPNFPSNLMKEYLVSISVNKKPKRDTTDAELVGVTTASKKQKRGTH